MITHNLQFKLLDQTTKQTELRPEMIGSKRTKIIIKNVYARLTYETKITNSKNLRLFKHITQKGYLQDN